MTSASASPPFAPTEAAALWQGDSRTLLGRLPDHSVDLICTDPPYNLGAYSTGNIEMSWRKSFNNDVAGWDQVAFEPAAWLDEFRRVLKPTGTIFAFTSYNLLGRWHEAFDPAFDTFQFVVWHKTNPPPKLRRAGFLNSCELIVACWDAGHTWNFTRQRDMHNFIEAPICGGNERVKDPVHPTQKPLRVLRQLIEWGSRPGDIVLDPFMGVGSTGVAALELGRRFVGIDLEEPYVAAARRRMAGVAVAHPGEPSERVDNDPSTKDTRNRRTARMGVTSPARVAEDARRARTAASPTTMPLSRPDPAREAG